MYIYIYTYIYTYFYIYMYTHTHRSCSSLQLSGCTLAIYWTCSVRPYPPKVNRMPGVLINMRNKSKQTHRSKNKRDTISNYATPKPRICPACTQSYQPGAVHVSV